MVRFVFFFVFFLIAGISLEGHTQTRNLSSLAVNMNERANCHPELGCPNDGRTTTRFRLTSDAERFNEGFMRVHSSLRPNFTSGAKRPVRVIFDFEDGLGLALPVFDTSMLFIENRFKFFNEETGGAQCISFKMRY